MHPIRRTLVLLAVIALACGCIRRVVEINTTHLDIPKEVAESQLHALTVNQYMYAGDIAVGQGKEITTEGSLAASVAATLRDLTAAYSGDAKREGDSGPSETSAPTTAMTDNSETATETEPEAESPTTDDGQLTTAEPIDE